MSDLIAHIQAALTDKINPAKAIFLPKYFKAFPGGYGEGDLFLGVSVPDQRAVAKLVFKEISLTELSELIKNEFHECRATALYALVYRYQKSKKEEAQKTIVDFYLSHLDFVNNWDLVDSSAYQILGHYFHSRDKSICYQLADSPALWRQRVAMISSFYWIKEGDFHDAIQLAISLIHHPHDLMHKAVGWMIREIANRDFEVGFDFLKRHYTTMPRTSLRYAIEKFPEELRQDFLKGRI